ncbi:hypothetical protein LA080_015781 [Diaporthe eres]|nr:hypothetical protein LA080_015781 [Diaporthe eres]
MNTDLKSDRHIRQSHTHAVEMKALPSKGSRERLEAWSNFATPSHRFRGGYEARKTVSYDVGMFRATDAKEHRGVIPLCDTSPARWAQRSCMTAAVSRDIRGLTKDACGSKAWATLGTTTSSEPRQE